MITWKQNADDIKHNMNKYWENILRRRISLQPSQQQQQTTDNVINNLEQYLRRHGYMLDANDLPHDPLTIEEIKQSIDEMPLKKAAGKDGIPIEFYIIHTDIHNPNIDKVCLLNFLLRMYNESYDCNNLTPSHSQNIVTLLFIT